MNTNYVDRMPASRFKRLFEWWANGNPLNGFNAAYVDNAGVP